MTPENKFPSRKGRFCFKARPHKGFYRRRSLTTLRIEPRGERRIETKDALSGRKFYRMLAGSLCKALSALWGHFAQPQYCQLRTVAYSIHFSK